jgi:hypothetical protein
MSGYPATREIRNRRNSGATGHREVLIHCHSKHLSCVVTDMFIQEGAVFSNVEIKWEERFFETSLHTVGLLWAG